MRVAGIEVSNPDKVFFPDAGITKGDIVEYYGRVAETMIPHVRDRPLTMHRYPNGIEGGSFMQKDIPNHFPDWIERVEVEKENGTVTHPLCQDRPTLVYLANQACLTCHVWLSRRDRLRHPDRMVFDLDPQTDDSAPARWGARRVAGLLEELRLRAYVMTTGSRGYHVVVSLDRSASFDEVRSFSRRTADLLARRHPDRLTIETRKAARRGRVFIDYLRNAYAQTAVAPYSVRARRTAPVATPLDWEELAGTGSQRYTVTNLFRRLAQKADPWSGMAEQAASLDGAEAALDGLEADG